MTEIPGYYEVPLAPSTGRGGHRQGAGRPPKGNPKKKITIAIDCELLALLKEQSNYSGIIESLIKDWAKENKLM